MNPRKIGLCAQLSCALEVACPKPGNVNRFHDFQDTTLEHYLTSAIAVGGAMRKAAEAGFIHASKGAFSEIGIGKLIFEAVSESRVWHRGRNTNLGIAALLVPLCSSYGSAIHDASDMGDDTVREMLHSIMKSTTASDTLYFYRAIRDASPGGLGKHYYLDVNDPKSDNRIIDEGLNLFQVLKMSPQDSVARELTEKMRITFEIGSPAILDAYYRSDNLRDGILHGYMKILSEVPDTLIIRKKGLKVAEDISREARRIMELGLPQEKLKAFDEMLRREDNALNPGTTADLTAASLMVCLLKGARP